MQKRKLGATAIDLAPLILGGNVFGWTADRATSFAILDAFLDAGFNAIDTADVYNRFAPGLEGGESETVIGEWIKDRGVRDRVILITKGGLPMGPGMEGLGRDYLPRACESSLRRLQTDYIDVYMSHRADPETPVEETLAVYQHLIETGKIRYAGCSNYSADQLRQAQSAAVDGLPRYEVVEPHYNLIERALFENEIEKFCVANRVGVTPYYGLAAGFLTGKYRSEDDLADSARAGVVSQYLNPHGLALLSSLDEVASRHRSTPAGVALAWLMARPSVTAPIASTTSMGQLREILSATELTLTAEDMACLENPPG